MKKKVERYRSIEIELKKKRVEVSERFGKSGGRGTEREEKYIEKNRVIVRKKTKKR